MQPFLLYSQLRCVSVLPRVFIKKKGVRVFHFLANFANEYLLKNPMRMKKTVTLSLLAFAFGFVLQGCLNYTQETYINKDGSGTMRVHYWTHLPDSLSLEGIQNIYLFNEDSLRSEFTTDAVQIEDVEVYSDTTDSTKHAVFELSFTSIDSLATSRIFKNSNISLKDGAPGQKVLSQFIPPVTTGFGVNDSLFRLTYVYEFPGEIISHNAQEVVDKQLTWSYSLAEIGEGKAITVTYKPNKLESTPDWIYYLTGSVLLLVVYFLLRKKRD